jgi:hypothetical protein
MTNYAEASRLYRSLGWSIVAPSKPSPESKKPAEGVYNVFGREGSATCAQMDFWEENFPERNCLLKMPAGIIGIDVDHYWKKRKDGSWEKKKGYDYLLEDIVRIGDLPPTYSSTSRGTGQPSRIYFFAVETGIEFETQPYPDIELIQRHHRYACVWPSIHPDTGGEYKWYDKQGNECLPPRPSDLSPLPREWYEPLSTSRNNSNSSRIKSKTSETSSAHQSYSGSAEDWVEALDDSDMTLGMHFFSLEIESRPSPHIGHDELLSVLGKLNHLQFTRGELGARHVFELIIENYLRYTNEKDPMTELTNAIRYVAGKDFSPCQN